MPRQIRQNHKPSQASSGIALPRQWLFVNPLTRTTKWPIRPLVAPLQLMYVTQMWQSVRGQNLSKTAWRASGVTARLPPTTDIIVTAVWQTTRKDTLLIHIDPHQMTSDKYSKGHSRYKEKETIKYVTRVVSHVYVIMSSTLLDEINLKMLSESKRLRQPKMKHTLMKDQ